MAKKVKATQNVAKDVESKIMEFSVKDRLLLAGLLPKEGNIITLILARDIKQKVEISQDEFKKYDFKTIDNGSVRWQEPKKGFKITFTGAEMELLRTQVDSLDNTEKITDELLTLCLKIREKE